MHMHWRWGASATVRTFFVRRGGGPRFAGPSRGIVEANPPLLDPRILKQTLAFAITKWANKGDSESPPRWAPDSAPSTRNFEDLFRSQRLGRPTPADIKKGADLVTWLSATAFPTARVGKWEGTFFAHGLFFSHQHEPLKLKVGKVIGHFSDPLVMNSKDRQEWWRP